MNSYQKQVEAVIRATEFHSPTVYSWFGKNFPRLARAIQRALTPNTARNYLLFNLQTQLYNDFYCPGLALPSRQETNNRSIPANTVSFVEELSAANSGAGYWENGWDIRVVKADRMVVHKDGLELVARYNDCLFATDQSLEPGAPLSLHFPKEFLSLSPGFYMALSNRELIKRDSESFVRFYWNLMPEVASVFVRSATSRLNQANLPFKLKVLNDPSQFTRSDAAVLYIHETDYKDASEIVEDVYSEVGSKLKPGVPAFTKMLAEGLGLAEDPQGESFGMHRCRLLADGLIRAHEHGKKAVHERLQVVEERFAEEAVTFQKPFLNSGSHDRYSFGSPAPYQKLTSLITKTIPPTAIDSAAFVRNADEIGFRLSKEAVWHQDRCNWLGASSAVHSSTNGVVGLTYSALGPELYSGTSGVSLFLAELFAATRNPETRHTALGAMRQALSKVDSVPPANRLGLFSGWLGISFAAARVGAILNEEELQKRATQILQSLSSNNRETHEFDLIAGIAGAVAALVVLHDMMDDESLLDFAVQLGDELIGLAVKSDAGYSWESPAFPRQRHLTGFSHGSAGAAYALLELMHATGDSKYREAAELGYQYERHWFESEANNWPDFREEPGQSYRRKGPLSFACTWCHGAPGIALSRLRAFEILKDETCEAEAIIALETTRKMTDTTIRSGPANFSLCHGLGGNADVLLYGSQVLGQKGNGDFAQDIGNMGIERFGKRDHQWPCGTGAGETPNLMLGLAGIGYFYLRLHDPETPSLLILRRESFC